MGVTSPNVARGAGFRVFKHPRDLNASNAGRSAGKSAGERVRGSFSTVGDGRAGASNDGNDDTRDDARANSNDDTRDDAKDDGDTD